MDFSNFFESVPALIYTNVHLESDGLQHCDVCGEPVETAKAFFGRRQHIACACERAALAAEREEVARGKELLQSRERRKAACLPSRYAAAKLDDLPPESYLSSVCTRFCATLPDRLKDGRGLLLYGSVGSGKTYAARAVLNAVLEQGYVGFFATASDLLQLREMSDDAYFWQRVNESAVFALDDFAVTRSTAFAQERLFDAINGRYIAKRPTIVTTNLNLEAMKRETDTERARLFSRVLEVCAPVQVSGQNRRV